MFSSILILPQELPLKYALLHFPKTINLQCLLEVLMQTTPFVAECLNDLWKS